MLSDESYIVVEACGAITDLEDREGEVYGVDVHSCCMKSLTSLDLFA
jgi:hypothetical protein